MIVRASLRVKTTVRSPHFITPSYPIFKTNSPEFSFSPITPSAEARHHPNRPIGTASASMTPEPTSRISQRAPTSCQQCSRRKVKCSKEIPCSSCVSRGLALECRRESVVLSKRTDHHHRLTRRRRQGRQAESLQIDETVPGLSTPLPSNSNFDADSEIEPQTPLSNDRFNGSPGSIDTRIPIQTARSESADELGRVSLRQEDTDDTDVVDPHYGKTNQHCALLQGLASEAAISLDKLVWGSHDASRLGHRQSVADDSDFVRCSHEAAILSFHWECLAWMHNVVHLPTFEQQCARLQWSRDLPAASWSSLYYALMSVSKLSEH